MSMLQRAACAVLMVGLLHSPAMARNDGPVGQAGALLAFASAEGMDRLARSAARVDFPALANQFEAQSNLAFCGPTTAAIVLNALHPQSAEAPRDHGRLRPDDGRYLPPGLDLSFPRYTQENVLAKGPKTRAQVFGAPAVVDGKTVRDGGFQLRQLDALLRAQGAATRLVVADDRVSDEAIRRDLVDNLRHAGDFVVVNYRRAAVGQAGGGHISPLGAYDAATDSVLILDVNPSLYGWVWMPVATLIRGMRTFDSVENRGYILVRPR